MSREVVDACVVLGRFELPWRRGFTYRAFADPSGGSSDSMTLAIAHVEAGKIVIDVVREQLAPFDPDETVGAFADTHARVPHHHRARRQVRRGMAA